MEKDNIKENEIKSEVEKNEVQTSNIETTQVETNTKNQDIKEESTNIENSELITHEKNSPMKVILANILDQLLIVAGSSVLLLLCDSILRIFGYMFTRETGALVIAGGIIYFILNCIYAPIMENSKMNNTIAKKILNIN